MQLPLTKNQVRIPPQRIRYTKQHVVLRPLFTSQLVQQKPAILKGSTTKWHSPPTCWVKMETSRQSQFWWPIWNTTLDRWATSISFGQLHLEITAAFVVYTTTKILKLSPKNRWCITNIKHVPSCRYQHHKKKHILRHRENDGTIGMVPQLFNPLVGAL